MSQFTDPNRRDYHPLRLATKGPSPKYRAGKDGPRKADLKAAREVRVRAWTAHHAEGGAGWLAALEWARAIWTRRGQTRRALERAARNVAWDADYLLQHLTKVTT